MNVNTKNDKSCHKVQLKESSPCSNLSRITFLNNSKQIEKKVNEENESIDYGSYCEEEYWQRGPISARHCGTMLWNLHSNVILEMSIEKSLRLVNYVTDTVCAVSADGESCAIMHNIGIAYAQKDCVEVRGCDVVDKNDKFAKMMGDTIAFSSLRSGVVYILDEAGVQTKTSEKMTNLHQDVSLNVFLKGSKCGRQYKEDAIAIIAESYYKLNKDRTQKWLANGVKISYTKDGVLDISRDEGKIRVSTDMNGTARVSLPGVNITAIGGKEPQFVVRKDNLKVIYNGLHFIARNPRQAAGLDQDGLFKFFD